MNTKRSALKKMAGLGLVSAAVPSTWVKPMVESVFLPAHAETSLNSLTLSGNGRLEGFGITIEFITGSVRLAGNTIILNARFSGNITQSSADDGFSPTIDFSDIGDINGRSIRVGTSAIPPQICGDPNATPLANISNGINNVEIRYPIESNSRYTTIRLDFYPIFCGLRFLGGITFDIDVRT